MELFGGDYDPSGTPRYNFNSFPWSLVTVFVVISGEDWDGIMWEHMKCVRPRPRRRPWA